jgi:hypothetical protein
MKTMFSAQALPMREFFNFRSASLTRRLSGALIADVPAAAAGTRGGSAAGPSSRAISSAP